MWSTVRSDCGCESEDPAVSEIDNLISRQRILTVHFSGMRTRILERIFQNRIQVRHRSPGSARLLSVKLIDLVDEPCSLSNEGVCKLLISNCGFRTMARIDKGLIIKLEQLRPDG